MRPCIGTVIGNKNGNITDDLDTLFGGVQMNIHPLTEEEELAEYVTVKILSMLFLKSFQRFLIPVAEGLCPFTPGATAFGFFDCHKKRKIRQPIGVIRFEFLQFISKWIGT